MLKLGGRCIIISLLQDHILKLILDYLYAELGWMVRFHRCLGSEEKHLAESPDAIAMPVFAVVATKFKRMGDVSPVSTKRDECRVYLVQRRKEKKDGSATVPRPLPRLCSLSDSLKWR